MAEQSTPLHPAMARRAAELIARTIERARIQVSSEALAQQSISDALEGDLFKVEREVVLDQRSRVDLMVGRVAVEVKVQGSRRNIWRQVEKYAEHPDVDAIVIATGVSFRRNLADANGKPVVLASLARGWL